MCWCEHQIATQRVEDCKNVVYVHSYFLGFRLVEPLDPYSRLFLEGCLSFDAAANRPSLGEKKVMSLNVYCI